MTVLPGPAFRLLIQTGKHFIGGRGFNDTPKVMDNHLIDFDVLSRKNRFAKNIVLL